MPASLKEIPEPLILIVAGVWGNQGESTKNQTFMKKGGFL
jgi:hypothetical protein